MSNAIKLLTVEHEELTQRTNRQQRRWLGSNGVTQETWQNIWEPAVIHRSLRPDDLLNLQVDAHNLALDTSDPQEPLLARVNEGEPALVIVRHQVVSSGHPTAQDNISGRKKP